MPSIELSREQYVQVLGAVAVYAAIEGALRELQGQDMTDAEHPLFNAFVQAAPQYGLPEVTQERLGEQWVDALILEYAAVLNTYSEAQMWERFAWKLAEREFRRRTPDWEQQPPEQQFQAAASIYDRLGEEFSSHEVANVRVAGVID